MLYRMVLAVVAGYGRRRWRRRAVRRRGGYAAARPRWPARLVTAGFWGAVLAGALVLYEAATNRAQMAAGAAQVRESLTFYLAAAWVGTALALAVVLFLLLSLTGAVRRR